MRRWTQREVRPEPRQRQGQPKGTMKAIDKRLRLLEDQFVPRERGPFPLVLELRARQRRRAELEGLPYEEDDEPRDDVTYFTIADVLRSRYRRPEAPSDDGSSEGVTLVASAKAPTEA
jgi:hypothetical protein